MPIKRIAVILIAGFIFGSCNSAIYYTKFQELSIRKKASYAVDYATVIPNGSEATITYTDTDKNKTSELVTGKFKKEVILTSGQKGKFEVRIKGASARTLISSLTVNDQSITQQTQTGKKVVFHVAFKLP